MKNKIVIIACIAIIVSGGVFLGLRNNVLNSTTDLLLANTEALSQGENGAVWCDYIHPYRVETTNYVCYGKGYDDDKIVTAETGQDCIGNLHKVLCEEYCTTDEIVTHVKCGL